jgi:hypothetical protein
MLVLPELDADGDLPPGIHTVTLNEMEHRFGRFVVSDRRVHLFEKFKQMVEVAKASGIVERIIVGGSFVTAKPQPNDIDVVMVLSGDVDFTVLTPSQYAVTDRDTWRRVFRGDDLDVIVVRGSTGRRQTAVEFLQANRDNKKVGVVEVEL